MNMSSRYVRKKAQTKEKIFDAAIELFLDQGFDHTTIDQITQKASVAKGTFFNHFPTKDSILYYLSEKRFEQMKAFYEGELVRIPSAKERLVLLLRRFARFSEENRSLSALVSGQKIPASLPWMQEMFAEILADGQTQGEFRAGQPVHEVAELLVVLYVSSLLQWLECRHVESMEEALLSRLHLLFTGIC